MDETLAYILPQRGSNLQTQFYLIEFIVLILYLL